MTDLPRSFVWLMVAAGGLIAAALISFFMDLTEHQSPPPLTVNDVEGVWSAASDDGRLTVRADGSAELEGMTEPEVNCGQYTGHEPSTYTGPARWVFDTFPDESPGIRFDYPGPQGVTGKTCRIYLSISITDKYGTIGFLPLGPDTHYVRGASQPG